ncbi:MAG: hypothetical protein MR038_04635 [Oscillospiraceae bacterium]|nr:hypothetical protein [Oscillospiraceae bacterium]
MKDLTDIFSKAIERSAEYRPEMIAGRLGRLYDINCLTEDDYADNNWYLISKRPIKSTEDLYGYLSCRYPVALLTKYCPKNIAAFLDFSKILLTDFEEPLSCDENILKQYVPDRHVFDEGFLDGCDYSFDDERYRMVLFRLEGKGKLYIDSGNFMFDEIK